MGEADERLTDEKEDERDGVEEEGEAGHEIALYAGEGRANGGRSKGTQGQERRAVGVGRSECQAGQSVIQGRSGSNRSNHSHRPCPLYASAR